tara:strand:- start:2560 stop:2934 length:375 start_codon:yes stop_codon:yes gene_type:complete
MLKPKVENGQIWIEELDDFVTAMEYIRSIESTIEDELGEGYQTPPYSIKYTSCSNQCGDQWKEPFIKVYNHQAAESIANKLNDVGFYADIDCYEDDDGDDDNGRPIIRKLWSVELGLKIPKADL